ncbi:MULTISPECIES: TRAP transporter small permease subunit [Rhodophyticola]|jgi:TRAP-type mannitol/chloroaromatic compound transport system permease small subunit|uniref:TRAP transporter small permease subunit n=1 Tax=Rhodophyticola TaxID=2680018 RepID=UPI001B219C59|nr:TRAP transporter small permease subunit [Roseicyclus sp.]MBO6625886.1 TRAP transporter small permease subunit [Roseicyclus sp.]MBO6921881.1 TRAP transporter small permease subunit [Roseicyclus sp.]
MPRIILAYIRAIDGMNRFIGRIAMYLIFVLAGILLWSSISKTFFTPVHWTLETAQFVMVAYYVLGGPYSVQLGANVRMDLFYGNWSLRTKAWVDAFTVMFLIFYLGVLFTGAVSSTAYSLGYFGTEPFGFFRDLLVAFVTGGPGAAAEMLGFLERSPTAWRPYLWPIKVTLCIGVFLMLLQALAEFFRDIGRIRGVAL